MSTPDSSYILNRDHAPAPGHGWDRPTLRELCPALSYPEARHLTYEQLADRVLASIPVGEPYVILAESYSGPVAALLAARRVGDLRAVVFVASFVSRPYGRIGQWLSRLAIPELFRLPLPAIFLRWSLTDRSASPELVARVQHATSRVSPKVLAARLRDVLTTDFAASLNDIHARIIYLLPENDRLLRGRGLRHIPGTVVRVPGPHLLLQCALLQCAPEACLAAIRELTEVPRSS